MRTMFLCTCLPASLLAAAAQAANPNDFQVFNWFNGLNTTPDQRGRLYVPSAYNASQSYPLVVYLGGLGQAGTDNTTQVDSNIDNLLANAKSQQFFLYAPQSTSGWWSMDNNLPLVMRQVANAAVQYNINPGKIYVTGLSAGGGGTDVLMTSAKDLFSAFVPIAPSGSALSATEAAGLTNTPIWYYVARNDGTVGPGCPRDSVNALLVAQGQSQLSYPLNSAGNPNYNNGSPYYSDGSTFFSYNKVRFTEYASGGHGAGTWGRTYNEPQMYNWLFQQTNGTTTLKQGQTTYFNFATPGTGTNGVDSQGRAWNTAGAVNGWDYKTLGAVATFAKDQTGLRTGVQLVETQRFNSYMGMGNVPAGITLFDSAQSGSYWLAGNWSWLTDPSVRNPSQLVLHGLTPGSAYTLALFASITGNDSGHGYIGQYTVHDSQGDHTITFDASNNISQLITGSDFQHLLADANGELTLTITPVNGSRFALVNTLSLTAEMVPEPVGLGVMALGGLGLLRRRRH